MIHPEHIEAVAQDAYNRFRAKHPGHPTPPLPEWADLPEATRIRWRDNVVAADAVRDKTTIVTQEQCCFDAVTTYYVRTKMDLPVSSEPPNPEPLPPIEDKSQRPKIRRK